MVGFEKKKKVRNQRLRRIWQIRRRATTILRHSSKQISSSSMLQKRHAQPKAKNGKSARQHTKRNSRPLPTALRS